MLYLEKQPTPAFSSKLNSVGYSLNFGACIWEYHDNKQPSNTI